MDHRTCILFFTRTPYAESKAKQILRHKRRNRRVIQLLYRRTKSTLQQSGIPFLELNEDQQEGVTFGERLTNGIEKIFRQGFEEVIVVGNDTPHLSVSDLYSAREALGKGHQVMGGSAGGGAYLIGLNRSGFDFKAFENLPWNTDSLGAELKTYLTEKGSLYALHLARDINRETELRLLLKQGILHRLRKILLNILTLTAIESVENEALPVHYFYSFLSFRGPPLGYLVHPS